MWKILALLAFCALLSPSQSPKPGNKCAYSVSELEKGHIQALEEDGLLKRHFETIIIADLDIGLLVRFLCKFLIIDVKLIAFKLKHFPNTNCAEMVIEVKIFLQLRLLGKVKVVYVSAYVDLSISTTYCHTNFLGGSYDLDITECDCFVVGLHIDIMDGLISVLSLVRIQSRITADLTAKVCGIIAVLLDILKLNFLAAVNVNVGLGSYGTCACQLAEMPRMTEADLSVAVLVKITSAAGNEYTIPSSATSIARPILSRYSFCQAIHPELIKLFVMLYTKKLEREFTCTPDRYSGAIGLRLTLLGIITGDLALLSIRIHKVTDIEIKLGVDKLTVELYVQLDMFTKNRDGTIVFVVRLKCKVALIIKLSVTGSKLIMIASLGRVSISLLSSDRGILQVSSLLSHCNDLLAVIFIPEVNGKIPG